MYPKEGSESCHLTRILETKQIFTKMSENISNCVHNFRKLKAHFKDVVEKVLYRLSIEVNEIKKNGRTS